MKNKSIFCTSPNKIITGGMTNLICFDKTGTLTEDFMDFYCLVPAFKKKFAPPFIKQDSSDSEVKKEGNF